MPKRREADALGRSKPLRRRQVDGVEQVAGRCALKDSRLRHAASQVAPGGPMGPARRTAGSDIRCRGRSRVQVRRAGSFLAGGRIGDGQPRGMAADATGEGGVGCSAGRWQRRARGSR